MIPETIETKRAFIALFSYVVDADFSALRGPRYAGVRYENDTDGRDDFHYDLARAIEDTTLTLRLPDDVESNVVYYEWLDDLGYVWDGVTEDDECPSK